MSHFSRLKTAMVRRDLVLAALKDMGYVGEVGTFEIRGFGGNRTTVEIRVRTRSPGHDIGLRRAGDAYEIVADWWGTPETTQERFFQRLVQRYAYHAVRATLESSGQFSLASETVDAEGKIHLVLRRAAYGGAVAAAEGSHGT
jgi:hypothetical protein